MYHLHFPLDVLTMNDDDETTAEIQFTHFVDMYPAGTCVREYPQKNEDDTSPRSVADQPRSFAIGMTATDIFT